MQVSLAVIFDVVATSDDLAGKHRVTLNTLADAEERCPHPVGVQQVEHLGCDFRIRSIVDGDSHVAAGSHTGRQRCPIGAQKTAAGPQSDPGQDKVIGDHGP